MPKILHNITERIEQAALSLFSQKDFHQVDMKMIAKKCNVAVGTLYNYYPNKKHLFIKVMQKGWQTTSVALDSIYFTQEWTPEEKLSHSIEVLYDDIENCKGMGGSIYNILVKHSMGKEMTDVFHALFFKIERVFEDFEKKSFSDTHDSINIRLAKTLIIMIQNSIISYPLAREDNLHFIQDFFYNSLHVDLTLKKHYLSEHSPI